MKLLVLTIIVAFLLLVRNDQRNMEEVEGSKHFYLSDGKSKQIYEQMKRRQTFRTISQRICLHGR